LRARQATPDALRDPFSHRVSQTLLTHQTPPTDTLGRLRRLARTREKIDRGIFETQRVPFPGLVTQGERQRLEGLLGEVDNHDNHRRRCTFARFARRAKDVFRFEVLQLAQAACKLFKS
jgi:hypothetical protein